MKPHEKQVAVEAVPALLPRQKHKTNAEAKEHASMGDYDEQSVKKEINAIGYVYLVPVKV